MQAVLLPIAVENHWIGVKLYIKEGKIQHGVYFNSRNDGELPNFRHIIKQQLEKEQLLKCGFQFVRNNAELQQPNSDLNASGVYLVENMATDVRKTYLKKSLTEENKLEFTTTVGKYHLSIMQKYNPIHSRRGT